MKRFFLFFILIYFNLPANAQQRWGGGVDYEPLHFGFSFHYVSSSLKVFSENDNIISPLKGGVGLGLLGNLTLSEDADLRFNPSVLFAGKQLDFNDLHISKSVKASLLEFPLMLKYKSDRRNNYRIYLIGGGKYSRNIIPSTKLDDSELVEIEKYVKLKPEFFSYEFGLGVDIYFEYFKMSPEIKWSQSFGDVLDKQEISMFNSPIDRLLLRSIQFSLVFE